MQPYHISSYAPVSFFFVYCSNIVMKLVVGWSRTVRTDGGVLDFEAGGISTSYVSLLPLLTPTILLPLSIDVRGMFIVLFF